MLRIWRWALGGLIALDCKNLPSIKYGFASFKGVKKRLQHLFRQNGIDCYEDFAHSPDGGAVGC